VTTPTSREPTGSGDSTGSGDGAASGDGTGSRKPTGPEGLSAPTARDGPAGWVVTRVITRATELALILVGLGFIFVSVGDDELIYLGIWDLLALGYVGVGAIALRRSRLRPPSSTPEPPRRDRYRFNFAFAIVSSLIGFTVAIDIATGVDPLGDNPDEHLILLNILGVIAMIMSWMLLQAGYARRYASIYRAAGDSPSPTPSIRRRWSSSTSRSPSAPPSPCPTPWSPRRGCVGM
jgi:hypothetical protein